MFAAAAVFALGACDQLTSGGNGPPLPPLQAGAVAPTVLPEAPSGVQQAQVTSEVREQLIANIGEQLTEIQNHWAPGTSPPEGSTDQIFPMQPSSDHRFAINLTGGTRYSFVGACDGDCTNVDIELIDARTGGVVSSDLLPDDYPVVHYQPSEDGSYLVRVLMRTCTIAPCYAGARALQQPAGTGTGK
jgi:hypothetical protein